jgi:hypothetical protein
MKRLLLILMMIALPFQVSWAAVGSYCQDEKVPVSQHFGHHQHAAQFKSIADSADHEKSSNSADECGFCHLSCTKFLPALPSLTAPTANTVEFSPPASRIYLSPTISPAEDPDWTLAA